MIDGVTSAPHQPFAGAGHEEGIAEVPSSYIIREMGLKGVRWSDDSGGMIGGAMILAVDAVAAGRCNYALVVRPLHNPREGRYGHGGEMSSEEVSGPDQFRVPYGFGGPSYHCVYYQRYLWKYNKKREGMAPMVVNARRNALMYEHSYWYQNRPEALSEKDYLDARMVCEPLVLYDCDIPVQACGAFVVTTAERARDLKQRPAYVLGYSMGSTRWRSGAPSLEDFEDNAAATAKKLWDASGLTPKDVGVANLYDGYASITPVLLEAFGICAKGESFDLFKSGAIKIEGERPLDVSTACRTSTTRSSRCRAGQGSGR